MSDTQNIQAGERTQSHTPGPWRIGDTHKNTVSIYGRSVDCLTGEPLKNDTYVCAVQEGAWIYEQAANARLIAAAPELLKACKELLESTWGIVIGGHPSLADSQSVAQEAIAKAEGRQ